MTPTPTGSLTDLRVLRGRRVPNDAPICVVVMSVHSEPTTCEALASIIDQDVEAEVVVVNTGQGSVHEAVKPHLDRITLVETPSQQYAGGARNLGIRHSTAPIVAFLAADCLATKGWLARRIEGHRTHCTAASYIRPVSTSDGVTAAGWAAYVVIHYRRMPEVEPPIFSACGQSYDRTIFDKHGLFDEQMRIAEDSAFNAKIEPAVGPPLCDPDIITLHRYPVTLGAAVADQFRRGRRLGHYNKRPTLRFALGCLKGNFDKFVTVRRSVPISLPVYALVAGAQSAGILWARVIPTED